MYIRKFIIYITIFLHFPLHAKVSIFSTQYRLYKNEFSVCAKNFLNGFKSFTIIPNGNLYTIRREHDI